MKILRLFPFIALLAGLSLTSCKEEIDFDGDFEETAIVYGLLDQADSIHYIKITRAFGGTNNSLEVAQISDSSYFQNIDVVIDEVINNTITRTWTLDDTILTNKQSGVFYSPEQKVYYFKTDSSNPLLTTAVYKLRATVNNGEFTVYGETSLVKDVSFASPNPNGALAFATSDVAQNGYTTATIKANVGNSSVVDARLFVYFDEYIGAASTEKSFTWKLGEIAIEAGSTSQIFPANGKTFFELVRDNATDDNAITKRELSHIKLQITAGSEDLYRYIELNKPSSGLAQNKPSFTNLTASNGRRVVGLFSSRSTVIMDKPEWLNIPPTYYRAIDNSSTKELCTGTITGGLLFCSDHPNDAATPYFCN